MIKEKSKTLEIGNIYYTVGSDTNSYPKVQIYTLAESPDVWVKWGGISLCFEPAQAREFLKGLQAFLLDQ